MSDGIERGTPAGIPGARAVRPKAVLEDPLSEEERRRYESHLGKAENVSRAPRNPDSLCALVADGEPRVRRDASAVLSEWGVEVLEAEGGVVALEMLAARTVDLLVCDLKLPEMDGFALIRGARSFLRLRDTFILALSGPAEPSDESAALNLGADLFYRKPCPPDLLLARLKPVVRRLYERLAPRPG